MARARNLKPSFFANDKLAEIPPLGRLLFEGLWCVADREGRLEDRPKRIKVQVLPYDACDVDALLNALAERGFIQRYVIGGQRLIAITNFSKHQNPHCKEPPSTIPAPDSHGASTMLAPEFPEPAGPLPPSPSPLPSCPKPPPSSPSLIRDSPNPATRVAITSPRGGELIAHRTAKRKVSEAHQTAAAATEGAFCTAYLARYGAEFKVSKKSRGQFSQLVERIGQADAPAIAAHFLTNNSRWYVERGHSPGCLLADAEKLHTEWVTGRRTSSTEARQKDRTQALASAFGSLIEKARDGTNG